MKTTNNRIKVLDDGRVEITLLMPLSVFHYKRWVKFYTRVCELVIEGDKIMAVRCPPKVWEDTLKSQASNRPKLLENFWKIVKDITEKRKRILGRIVPNWRVVTDNMHRPKRLSQLLGELSILKGQRWGH